ncbi:MAG: MoaD/ThiS family protein [Promethearchaeia archaeon]
MRTVKIKFLSLLKDLIGSEEIELSIPENSTIKELLEELNSQYGEKFKDILYEKPNKLNKGILIGLNGKNIRDIDNLDTKIEAEDEITFMPAIAGG